MGSRTLSIPISPGVSIRRVGPKTHWIAVGLSAVRSVQFQCDPSADISAVGSIFEQATITHTGSDLIRRGSSLPAESTHNEVRHSKDFGRMRDELWFPSAVNRRQLLQPAAPEEPLRLEGWSARISAAAVFVAASRLSENRHYESDVIVRRHHRFPCGAHRAVFDPRSLRFAVTPIVTPQGAGFALVKVSR